MSIEKRQTVLFPLHKEDSEVFILLGRNAEGKKMPWIRNGFGGKCEEKDGIIEDVLDCVIRETKEETAGSIDLDRKREFIKVLWDVIMNDVIITFFTIYLDGKINIFDNSEMVNIRWFNIKNTNEFLFEMLSGDEDVIKNIQKFVDHEDIYKEFSINKTWDKILQEQIKNIYKEEK